MAEDLEQLKPTLKEAEATLSAPARITVAIVT